MKQDAMTLFNWLGTKVTFWRRSVTVVTMVTGRIHFTKPRLLKGKSVVGYCVFHMVIYLFIFLMEM